MHQIARAGFISASIRDVPPFEVLIPETLAEALEAMTGSDRPVPYAGGTHLCAAVRQGAEIGTLVWLKRLDELRDVARDSEVLSIGALMTHHDGAASEAAGAIPGLSAAWKRIANVRVRNAATIGGNLMARHRRYEMSILVTALGGIARFASNGGEVALTPQEIWAGDAPARSLMTRINIPLEADLRLDYDRSLRPIMTQALALWTDASGKPRGRSVVATEYLQPVAMELDLSAGADPKMVARAAYEALPDDFADPATGNAYLRQAGTALLARQLERLAGVA
jgi:carbon-monoxide dehydrogenase medium subunit